MLGTLQLVYVMSIDLVSLPGMHCSFRTSFSPPSNQHVSYTQVRTFEFSDFIKKCAWYMLFCFFWSGQYIIAVGEIIFAMAGKLYKG